MPNSNDTSIPVSGDGLTEWEVTFEGVTPQLLVEMSVKEVNMVESLLTPGLQTTIKYDHAPHNQIVKKDMDRFKGAILNVDIKRPILKEQGFDTTEMSVVQRLYRLEDRTLINPRSETFVFQACDDSLLTDARNLVSKSWRCTTPTDIVKQVLNNCAKVGSIKAEESTPTRDYIAENIHPFQVVTQQADVALANGNDPSFVHFMTYEGFKRSDPRGLHHFESLHKMAQQEPILRYIAADSTLSGKYTSVGEYNGKLVTPAMTYSFPADFDLLSDILNGLEGDGNSSIVYNPLLKTASVLGSQTTGCGMGAYNAKESWTNRDNPNLVGCPTNVEKYLHKRQARMGLLDPEDVALRLTVPWNPLLHVGKVIEFFIPHRQDPSVLLYGSGKYLISSLVHNIRLGGFSTITLDCVSNTVAKGEL